MGVHVFGDAKIFCPNLIFFFPNNVQTGSLNVKIKTCHCKQIKVSACLISNYRSSKPYDLNQQSIFSIATCQQWQYPLCWKMLADCNNNPQKIAVHATTCGRCCSASSFSSFYIRYKPILPTRSS